jgi:hypothetical protein
MPLGGSARRRETFWAAMGFLWTHHVARRHADIEAVYTYERTDSVQSPIVGRCCGQPISAGPRPSEGCRVALVRPAAGLDPPRSD